MTQPHHHVFNALEPLLHRKVPILPLIPILTEKGVISSEQESWFRDEQNGIKILTGYLRNKDYDTFLNFMESVFEAGARSDGTVDFSLMKSVRQVVADFDVKFETAHADRIQEIIDRYTNKQVTTAETLHENGESNKTDQMQSLTDQVNSEFSVRVAIAFGL